MSDQAALVAGLIAERDAALARQTATAEVLEVINANPGNLGPVFAAILKKAHSIAGANRGCLFLYDGIDVCGVAVHGYSDEVAAVLMRPNSAVENRAVRAFLAGERYFQMEDVRSFAYGTGAIGGALRTLSDVRTSLVIPLRKEGVLLGMMSANRTEVRPYRETEIAVLQTFAAQAVIAMENARLLGELRLRTEELATGQAALAVQVTHQEASIDVLKVMSSTSSDTTPVFNTILNRAVRLCDGLYGTLFQFDGTLLHLSAIDGFSRELSESFASQFPRPLSQSFASGRAILSRQVVIVRDTGADADLHQSILAMGHKSLVALPLLRDGDAVGALVVGHASVDGFSDAHVALLKPFAEQAVIAIGSVATFRELQRRTADLTEALEIQSATADVLKVISRSAFDLDTVLDTLTRSAATLCGAETGSVRVRHGEGFRMGATYGLSPEFRAYTDTMPMQPGRGSLSARIMLSKTIEHIPDFELDPELGPALKARTPNRAALGVPLLREGRLEGWFILGRRAPVTFTQRQIDLVQTFADQAMIAIENARLFEEVQARTRELSASLDELRAAQDRLVQTEKLASLGQLTAGIAHEIKNPLNFVNNFSALSAELVDELREVLAPVGLEARVRDEVGELTAMLKGNLEKVVAHGKRADGIVRNMLLHSREGGDDRRLVQLNTIVEEALNLAYHGARAEKAGFNVTLERDYDVGAGVISMYPQEFTRVLLNLIGNGFYASATKMREGGDASYVPTVTVRTVSLAEEVEVRVRDNGTGIPDAVRAKMFNPFFTTKPAGEGTGLGLSLSHDIVVKQHGGRIEVETEPGEFTEFIITLPRGGTAA